MRYVRPLLLSFVPLVALTLPGILTAQVPATSSTNFILETYSFQGANGLVDSPNFQLNGSLGQPASQWSASSSNLVALGFWPSFTGGPESPEIRVVPGIAPGDAGLEMLALFPTYQIYRSVNPNDVLLNPLTTSTGNTYEDTGADAFTVLFYQVDPGT